MYSDQITTKDRNFASAIVRSLCGKTCTFSVNGTAMDEQKACIIHPFMLYQSKANDKYLYYQRWLMAAKIPTGESITIRVHADASGQAHKVITLAEATQKLDQTL